MPPESEPIESEPIEPTVAITLAEYRQELRNAELSAARLAREVTCPHCYRGHPVRFVGHSDLYEGSYYPYPEPLPYSTILPGVNEQAYPGQPEAYNAKLD
jgi:hypothetical protein